MSERGYSIACAEKCPTFLPSEHALKVKVDWGCVEDATK